MSIFSEWSVARLDVILAPIRCVQQDRELSHHNVNQGDIRYGIWVGLCLVVIIVMGLLLDPHQITIRYYQNGVLPIDSQ